MPHYVNIALGIIFWPCLFVCGPGRLFDPAAGVGNVPHVGRTKSMTKNKPEGHGSGAAPKNAGANGRFLGAAGINLLFCLES